MISLLYASFNSCFRDTASYLTMECLIAFDFNLSLYISYNSITYMIIIYMKAMYKLTSMFII